MILSDVCICISSSTEGRRSFQNIFGSPFVSDRLALRELNIPRRTNSTNLLRCARADPQIMKYERELPLSRRWLPSKKKVIGELFGEFNIN